MSTKRTKRAVIGLLSHPLRLEIMRYLSTHEAASPKMLADAFEVPVENVAYHVNLMRSMGTIEVNHEMRVRGAIEHYYRLNRTQVVKLADELLSLTQELRSFS